MSIAALIIAALFVAYTLVRAELEKHELKRALAKAEGEIRTLTEKLVKRALMQPASYATDGDAPDHQPAGVMGVQRGRPGRFKSFGASKRSLNEYEPTPEELKR
jgi:hypothetical protein